MRKIFALVVATLMATTAAVGADSRAMSFNDGWRFSLNADSAAFATNAYADGHWRQLSLPHDWAIEGDFDQNNPSGTGGGALPGGIGWYRKTFATPEMAKGDHLMIDFDGAYMNSTVYINGHCLGTRPYGYASFSYDLTPYLNRNGQPNVVAVRVDNAEQPNSRWYSGCGIYRNVWLRHVGAVHVPLWGQHVITDVTDTLANVIVKTEIANSGKARKVAVRTVMLNPDGTVAHTATQLKQLQKGENTAEVHLTEKVPQLWSTQQPQLYTLITTVKDDKTDQLLDTYTQRIGLRYFDFDPANGFSLNGKPMKINGVCMHHDMGALGAAVNRRAIERQLQIMQAMGANAYRCSHNPPAPEVLDLCDSMGILVMDETFDMWRKKKTAHDYARYFDEWHERDLGDQMRRDRNHPSVFMWSIGNEVLEQWSSAEADTLSLEQANLILNFGHGKDMLAADGTELSVNSLLTRKLADMVRQYDTSRPITAGCNEPDPGNHLFRSGALDVIGYNYHDEWFADVPANFPGKPFIITESVSGLMTRGHYVMPSDSMIICPDRWDIPYSHPSFACSAYDNCHVPWGNAHEGTLRLVEQYPHISGQFIWTGFDYIGEPTPYGWPARSSYFGIVDLAGFPKDVYSMYQSVWRPDTNVLHLFPHWNWSEGQDVDLWAYYNNADEVELYVNGRSVGKRAKQPGQYHVMWRVPYEAGEVTAVSRLADGTEVSRQTVRTAGQPAAIRLTPDRTAIAADGRDLSFVTAEVVDADGNVCPTADHLLTFDVKGAGFNAGVDNGSPTSLERFKADTRRAFNGRALLIVQNADSQAGDITVTATAQGLKPTTVNITAAR